MKLVLRNQLAEWLLEALSDPQAEAPLRALIAFARQSDATGVAGGLDEGEATALATEERIFESTAHGVELREDLLGDLAELRWRAERFESALSGCRGACGPAPAPWRSASARAQSAPPDAKEIAWSISAAAALFNAELFFEVHELLEPPWGRAEGPLRSFLQGLIQVAVGLHHRSTGNLRGAISLLADGNAKLRPFVPEAWTVELATFCSVVDAIVARLREASGGGTSDLSSLEIALPRLTLRSPA